MTHTCGRTVSAAMASSAKICKRRAMGYCTPSSVDLGLTTAQAEERLRENGPNRIEEAKRSPALALLAKLNGPVPWMLEATLVLELVLHKAVEASIIGVLLVVN